jgi:BASS family bile acid:Na+ symporter
LLTGLFMPGPRHLRLTLALTGGNRNVGLIWSALGAALSPTMALYFACTQLPIYTLPRLLQALLVRLNR